MKTIPMKWLSILAVAAITFVGCSAPVHVQKDDKVDFSRYRTYSWADKDEHGKNENRNNQLMEQKFRMAVSNALEKQGWRLDNRRPDVLINYDVLVERSSRKESDPVYSNPFYRSFFNPYSRRYYTVYYPSQFMGYDNYSTPVREGTITISVTDARTDRIIWQGWTTDEVNSRNLTTKEINSAVKSIFKKFNDVAKQ